MKNKKYLSKTLSTVMLGTVLTTSVAQQLDNNKVVSAEETKTTDLESSLKKTEETQAKLEKEVATLEKDLKEKTQGTQEKTKELEKIAQEAEKLTKEAELAGKKADEVEKQAETNESLKAEAEKLNVKEATLTIKAEDKKDSLYESQLLQEQIEASLEKKQLESTAKEKKTALNKVTKEVDSVKTQLERTKDKSSATTNNSGTKERVLKKVKKSEFSKKHTTSIKVTSANDFRWTDLRFESVYTAEDLDKMIAKYGKGGLFEGKGHVFKEAESKYGVNALYLLAHAAVESAWGRSQIARDKNNFFGIAAFDNSPYQSAYTYDGIDKGILDGAKFISTKYLNGTSFTNQGPYLGNMSEGMNKYYATDPNWAKTISEVMFNMNRDLGNKELIGGKKESTGKKTRKLKKVRKSDLKKKTSSVMTAKTSTKFKSKEDQELFEKTSKKIDASTQGLTAHTANMKKFLGEKFGIKAFSLFRGDSDGTGHGHADGLAIDLMVTPGDPLGDEIAKYLTENYQELGIYYIIWEQKFYMDTNNIYGPAFSWNMMPDRGSITQNHYDHVHISFKK